jgi:hypothetical protein
MKEFPLIFDQSRNILANEIFIDGMRNEMSEKWESNTCECNHMGSFYLRNRCTTCPYETAVHN